MEFATQYKPNPVEKEKNSGKRMTEAAGYVPAKVRIEQMINAGRRLVESRQEEYDYPDGREIPEDGGPVDPTREKSFGFDDADRLNKSVSARLKEQQKRAIQLKKEEENAGKAAAVSGSDKGSGEPST